MTNLPSRPASGDVLTWKFMVSVGSSTVSSGSASGCSGRAIGHADADFFNTVDQHDVAGLRFVDLHALEAFEIQHLVDLRIDRRIAAVRAVHDDHDLARP